MLNAIKNVLAGLANLVAGILFIVVAHVAWGAAALIAVGSVGAPRSAPATAGGCRRRSCGGS